MTGDTADLVVVHAAEDSPEKGTAPAQDVGSESLIGEILDGRYELLEKLGQGGMGAVYRARHLTLERAVAVKILKAELTVDDFVCKRFDREALAASKLDHPNIVQVMDFGTAKAGMKYLVMQLLEGQELRRLVGQPMTPARAIRLGAQILKALEHAHRRSLVHRDLKPENVFVVRDDDGEEHAKLVDFGIVKLLDPGEGDEKLTRAGLIFGTPRYMSPEQAAGGKIDERTDLYAVGILLYEMLTGAPPFDSDDATIVLRMHMLADPPPFPPGVPEGLQRVCLRLLAKDRQERYASAREAREVLESLEVGDAPAAPARASVSADAATRSPTSNPNNPLLSPAPPLAMPRIGRAEPAPPPPAPAMDLTSPLALAMAAEGSDGPAAPPEHGWSTGGTLLPLPDGGTMPAVGMAGVGTAESSDPAHPPVPTTTSGTHVPGMPWGTTRAPPSGVYQTVLAIESPGPGPVPSPRRHGWAVLGLVGCGLIVWLVVALSMRDCSSATADPKAARDAPPSTAVGVPLPDQEETATRRDDETRSSAESHENAQAEARDARPTSERPKASGNTKREPEREREKRDTDDASERRKDRSRRGKRERDERPQEKGDHWSPPGLRKGGRK